MCPEQPLGVLMSELSVQDLNRLPPLCAWSFLPELSGAWQAEQEQRGHRVDAA